MENVLVTGATGFIGSNLVKRLAKHDIQVFALTREFSNLDSLQSVKEKVRFITYDGSIDSVFNAIDQSKPSCVFHLASLFLTAHKHKDVTPLVESNILFGTQLLEAMASFSIKNVINVSTSWTHYNLADYDPVCLYAATKKAFEDVLLYYVHAKKMSSISLELFDTYGPNDPRKKLFYWLNSANESDSLKMSPGEQFIDLVYIDDVIDGFIQARKLICALPEGDFNKYVISSKNPIKLKDLVELYMAITGKRIVVDWGGLSYREREIMTSWNRGESLPGWSPRVSLSEGIRKAFSETNPIEIED
jgi:nucleoside-diphosphate-sugar epimerase